MHAAWQQIPLNYVALIEFQLPTSRCSLPIWSCKTKLYNTSFVSNILTTEVIFKTHFLFFNCILVSDKFRQLKLIWSNFNVQPAYTVFRIDPVRQSSISPHVSVISWQLRWYWKCTFFFLNCIPVSDKFRQLKLIWSNFNCQPADKVFRFDPVRKTSISPHLSEKSWQLRWYWK